MKCNMCGIQESDKFYTYNPTRCKKCFAAEMKEVRHGNKQRAIKIKGGACQVCSYDKCPNNLVFHHIDPSTKNEKLRMKKTQHVYSVTGFVRTWGLIEKEIEKCVLLCRNCHGEVESGLISIESITQG